MELRPQAYPIQAGRPQLLQEVSIAQAQAYNQRILLGENASPKPNPKPRTEDANKIKRQSKNIIQQMIDWGKDRRKYTGTEIQFGSRSPYPRPNNFLHNERVGRAVNYEGQ